MKFASVQIDCVSCSKSFDYCTKVLIKAVRKGYRLSCININYQRISFKYLLFTESNCKCGDSCQCTPGQCGDGCETGCCQPKCGSKMCQ